MAKQSVGLVVYRRQRERLEILLVHPGGPFFTRKDVGVWSIPKGEFADDEDKLDAAKREFQEELGVAPPSGELLDLGSIKQKSGKTVYAWAIQGDLDCTHIQSNTFTIEWPAKSGQQRDFPEVDKAAWFDLPTAQIKLTPGQDQLLTILAQKLNVQSTPQPQQVSLF